MNHLIASDYTNIWKELTDKELQKTHTVLIEKINAVRNNSPSIVNSLTEILEILEEYMKERGLLSK